MPMTQPFSLMAQVYDAIMKDIDYEGWADAVLEHAAARGWQGERVLDLGCGTGNSSIPFYSHGYEVIGLDKSPEMLAIARDKMPVLTFLEADFRDFCLDLPVDLVVSMFDSLNNLTEPSDFVRAARCVWETLRPGGLFIFDINTEAGLRDLWEMGIASGYAGDVYYHWTHTYDDTRKLATVEALCRRGELSFTEVHTERAYDPAEAQSLLHEAGFEDICVLGFPYGGQPPEDALRVWMSALKPTASACQS
ncbi:MAG: class I SAM-dependent methyltransferase [Deinococcota bacterium]